MGRLQQLKDLGRRRRLSAIADHDRPGHRFVVSFGIDDAELIGLLDQPFEQASGKC